MRPSHAELMRDALREVEVDASIPAAAGGRVRVWLARPEDIDPLAAWRAFNVGALALGEPTLDVDEWVSYQLEHSATTERRAALERWFDGWGLRAL